MGRWRRVVLAALVGTGIVVTLWPVTETLRQDAQTLADARGYARSTAASRPAELAGDLAAAHRYNASLPAHLLDDPWGATPGDVAGPAHDAYLRVLARQDVMARVRVPRVGIDLPVVHDTDDASLRRGAGHMYGSALPVGGAGTHAVLAAHTAWRGATYFDRLNETRVGDAVAIDVAGEHLDYIVDDIAIVHAEQLARVRPVQGRDLLTLVTCITPPGQDKQRLLVRAHRVAGANSAVAGASPAPPDVAVPAVQRWMWPRLAVAALALLVLTVLLLRPRRAAAT